MALTFYFILNFLTISFLSPYGFLVDSSKLPCPTRCFCYYSSSSVRYRLVGNCSFVGETNLRGFNFSLFENSVDSIEALYLVGNRISVLHSGIFAPFLSLKLLDLSQNDIHSVDANAFKGLEKSLEILNLSSNPIGSLIRKSFGKLEKLRSIDLSTNSFVCDCNARSFIKYLKEKNVKLGQNSKCALPRKFRNHHIQSVSLKTLPCNVESAFNSSSMKFFPLSPKVILEGDELELRCSGLKIFEKQTVEWLLNGNFLELSLLRANDGVQMKSSTDEKFVHSILTISKVQLFHQGKWTCRLESDDAFLEKFVSVNVLPRVSFCSTEVTVNEKGRFTWKQTARGTTVYLECPNGAKHVTNAGQQASVSRLASRACGPDTRWQSANTEQCSYFSDFVSLLARFEEIPTSSANLLSDKDDSKILELSNLTKNQSYMLNFDSLEMDLLLKLLENRLNFVKPEHSSLLVKIVNSLMDVKAATFVEDLDLLSLPNRILTLLKKVPLSKLGSSAITLTMSNLAICEMSVNAKNYEGIFVGYFDEPSKQLLCVSSSFVRHDSEMNIPLPQSSMELPASLISFDEDNDKIVNNISIRFMWFRSPAFFPDANFTNLHKSAFPVLGVYMGDSLSIYNSINISAFPFRFRWKIVDSSTIDSGECANYKIGHWSQTGKLWKDADCSPVIISQQQIGAISFDCQLSFGFFTLLNKKFLLGLNSAEPVYLPPWMILSSGFAITCQIVAILFYCCSKTLEISVKLRHCLINFWFSSSLLTLLLCVGFDQISTKYICFCVSVAFHFFLLLTWFWMLLLCRTLQRKLSKLVNPPEKLDEEIEEPIENARRSQLIGMYSFAIGLSVMPCAFTLALSKTADYLGDKSMCFMAPGSAMVGSIAIPCGLAFTLSICFLLRASCLFSSLNDKKRKNLKTSIDLENADGNIDEELETLTQPNHVDNAVVGGDSDNNDDLLSLSSSCIDRRIYIGRHLSYTATLLFLNVLSTAFVCLYVRHEPAQFFMEQGLPHYDKIVSVLYSACSTLLGISIIWCYVLSRPDVGYSVCCCCECKTSSTSTGGAVINGGNSRSDKNDKGKNGGYSENGGVSCSNGGRASKSDNARNTTKSPMKVNAGTATSAKFDAQNSRHSVATSNSVVSANSYGNRYQLAVAKKYYSKRRSLRSTTGGASIGGPDCSQSMMSEPQRATHGDDNDDDDNGVPHMSLSLTTDSYQLQHQQHQVDENGDSRFGDNKYPSHTNNGKVVGDDKRVISNNIKDTSSISASDLDANHLAEISGLNRIDAAVERNVQSTLSVLSNCVTTAIATPTNGLISTSGDESSSVFRKNETSV